MNYQEIEIYIKDHGIKDYTIRENLVVDVCGIVDLSFKYLTELPFQFGKVTGSFHCYNNRLTSLLNCPHTILGSFNCANNRLTSLQYCPAMVGGNFYCDNNKFVVTKENAYQWLQAIKNNRKAYFYIKNPPEEISNFYKLLYEI